MYFFRLSFIQEQTCKFILHVISKYLEIAWRLPFKKEEHGLVNLFADFQILIEYIFYRVPRNTG